MLEPYVLGPLILLVVVLVAAMLDRWSVPVILVALGVGILFGSDVLGWWHFSDAVLTNRVASMALVLILFQGGYSTRRESLQSVLPVAGALATGGVVLTALITTLVLWQLFGWSAEVALLVGVIISSTDAAATFSILRRQAIHPRLASTIEVESAANDPMAILLTLSAIEFLSIGDNRWRTMLPWMLWQFAAGIGIGYLLGHAVVWIFNRLRPQDRGHYYILCLGAVLLIYGLAELAQSSSLLAVFVAGHIMGNRPYVHKQSVANFMSSLSTLAEVCMFVMMGLLVFPRQWAGLWRHGLLLFLTLTFLARPIAVFLCMAGVRLGFRKKLFVSWAGLRGAVPVILATYPLAAGLAVGEEVFNLVFFVVMLSIMVQGSTLGWIARRLHLSVRPRPNPFYSLELVTMAPSALDLIVVDIPGRPSFSGPLISELCLPSGCVIVLIARGRQVVTPKGNTRLHGGDQVTVLGHVADEPAIRASLTASTEADDPDPQHALIGGSI